mmetsp:Transcript_105027/g.303881  ORF Transcript_105027/g.303881 Transcript_105027/m.303881 type:complete len:218 (-) Transcript_105027:7-660(-)
MPSWYFAANFESFCRASMHTESCVIGCISVGKVAKVATTFAGTALLAWSSCVSSRTSSSAGTSPVNSNQKAASGNAHSPPGALGSTLLHSKSDLPRYAMPLDASRSEVSVTMAFTDRAPLMHMSMVTSWIFVSPCFKSSAFNADRSFASAAILPFNLAMIGEEAETGSARSCSSTGRPATTWAATRATRCMATARAESWRLAAPERVAFDSNRLGQP